jgi:hypothetical protein
MAYLIAYSRCLEHFRFPSGFLFVLASWSESETADYPVHCLPVFYVETFPDRGREDHYEFSPSDENLALTISSPFTGPAEFRFPGLVSIDEDVFFTDDFHV